MKVTLFTWLICLFAVSVQAKGKTVIYNVNGGSYEGYYTSHSSKSPFILLIHDWDGLTGYEIQRADMLNDLGYTVFAADLFGKGVRPTETEDKKKLTSALYGDREKMRALMLGAIETASSMGAQVKNGMAMGYCFGGTAVLELARSGADFKGFAIFHGGLETPLGQNYTETKGRILIFHGTADSSVSMDHFATLARELERDGVPHEMISYGGAPHAFTVYGSERYRKDADMSSWLRLSAFLTEIFPR